ncbi:MAG TPA: HD domain-containing protein [Nitrososphaeraceae archaeon]|jgi:5'-deoxynucleotidase|nr:HD domain-containing protein [Nitrososphaeraceae archaeon]
MMPISRKTQQLKMVRKPKDVTQFFQYAMRLKYVKRAGWISKVKVQNPESVADHTFCMCAISMVLSDILGLDTQRVMKMVILHDLAESIIGDYIPGQISEKHKRLKEKKAINSILYCIPSDLRGNYRKIWNEYIQNKTDVAQLVHRVDKIEMMLQAMQYAKEGYPKKLLHSFLNCAKRRSKGQNKYH